VAITQTNLSGQVTGQGGPPSGMLKLGAINCAIGAAETSVAIDWSLKGITTVVAYGATPRDTYTNNVMFHDLSGTTVTYTWSAADIANIVVWALGY